MSEMILISDAAKKVNVEAHVLRYWEDELGLPIKRNELGHRYYTKEDVKRFQEIRDLKEKGLQLKAIRMFLKNGKLSVLPQEEKSEEAKEKKESKEIFIQNEVKEEKKVHELVEATRDNLLQDETREQKSARLQWLLQQLFKETLKENNEILCREMKESILKEMDYQFRMQEEREEERENQKIKRDEEHFKKIDELLRKKRGLLRK